MKLLCSVFHIEAFATDFFSKPQHGTYSIKVRNAYIDHNGGRLNDDIITKRHTTLKGDLSDMADMIRGNLEGKRIEVFNGVKKRLVRNIQRVPQADDNELNPYLSRIESIIPMNFLHIFANIKNDNTTDIIDLGESVRLGKDATIEIDKDYIVIPGSYADSVLYGDIDIYPRYIPLYIPDLLTLRWSWMMYQNVGVKLDFINYIEQLHFKGNYMFSHEKSHILKDKVRKINDDIHSNHNHFYLTDLSMGIVFPFMISLFAFIHLKTEFAFLLMFKNRIREILFIFWLLPLLLMLIIKGGVVAVYMIYLLFGNSFLTIYVILPLFISFLFAAAFFYPINKWCFSPFTGDNINLHELHKGR